MRKRAVLGLLFLLVAGSLLPALEVWLDVDFSENPADWAIVCDGYTDPAFKPLLKIQDLGRDGKFLGILLERPPVSGTVHYMVCPVSIKKNPDFMKLRKIAIETYGMNLPIRMGVLLEDGSGRCHECDLGLISFQGERWWTHVDERDFQGLFFKALIIYLDGSIPTGECVVFIKNLSILGEGKP